MTTHSSSTNSTKNEEPPNSDEKIEWHAIALPIFAGILVVVVAIGCYLRFR